ncbi:MAG: hypothetical protein KGH77_06225 [Candidatus Micrarchaeota archaeon]|nr:hypothetical protein [Candidatus Micrarchaeota archaeon]MDE1864989.1 hypothetical protein [Candidatus Micrarchaeota archaeon]
MQFKQSCESRLIEQVRTNKLRTREMKDILKGPFPKEREAVVTHQRLTSSLMLLAVTDEALEVANAAARFQRLDKESVQQAMLDSRKVVRVTTFQHQLFTKEQTELMEGDKVLEWVFRSDVFFNLAEKYVPDCPIHSLGPFTAVELLSHFRLNQDTIKQSVYSHYPQIRAAAFRYQKLSIKQMYEGMEDQFDGSRESLVRYQQLPKGCVYLGIDDVSQIVQVSTVRYQQLSNTQVAHALQSKNFSTRAYVVEFQNLNEENLATALKDTSGYVRDAAKRKQKIYENFPDPREW